MAPLTLPAAKLLAMDVVLMALATGAVTLRLISTRVRKQGLHWHDYLCIASLVNQWTSLFGSQNADLLMDLPGCVFDNCQYR